LKSDLWRFSGAKGTVPEAPTPTSPSNHRRKSPNHIFISTNETQEQTFRKFSSTTKSIDIDEWKKKKKKSTWFWLE
jgi:hypothetical protein